MRRCERRLARGAMYDTGTEARFVWSPVAGWFMSLVPTIIGYWLSHPAVLNTSASGAIPPGSR